MKTKMLKILLLSSSFFGLWPKSEARSDPLLVMFPQGKAAQTRPFEGGYFDVTSWFDSTTSKQPLLSEKNKKTTFKDIFNFDGFFAPTAKAVARPVAMSPSFADLLSLPTPANNSVTTKTRASVNFQDLLSFNLSPKAVARPAAFAHNIFDNFFASLSAQTAKPVSMSPSFADLLSLPTPANNSVTTKTRASVNFQDLLSFNLSPKAVARPAAFAHNIFDNFFASLSAQTAKPVSMSPSFADLLSLPTPANNSVTTKTRASVNFQDLLSFNLSPKAVARPAAFAHNIFDNFFASLSAQTAKPVSMSPSFADLLSLPTPANNSVTTKTRASVNFQDLLSFNLSPKAVARPAAFAHNIFDNFFASLSAQTAKPVSMSPSFADLLSLPTPANNSVTTKTRASVNFQDLLSFNLSPKAVARPAAFAHNIFDNFFASLSAQTAKPVSMSPSFADLLSLPTPANNSVTTKTRASVNFQDLLSFNLSPKAVARPAAFAHNIFDNFFASLSAQTAQTEHLKTQQLEHDRLKAEVQHLRNHQIEYEQITNQRLEAQRIEQERLMTLANQRSDTEPLTAHHTERQGVEEAQMMAEISRLAVEVQRLEKHSNTLEQLIAQERESRLIESKNLMRQEDIEQFEAQRAAHTQLEEAEDALEPQRTDQRRGYDEPQQDPLDRQPPGERLFESQGDEEDFLARLNYERYDDLGQMVGDQDHFIETFNRVSPHLNDLLCETMPPLFMSVEDAIESVTVEEQNVLHQGSQEPELMAQEDEVFSFFDFIASRHPQHNEVGDNAQDVEDQFLAQVRHRRYQDLEHLAEQAREQFETARSIVHQHLTDLQDQEVQLYRSIEQRYEELGHLVHARRTRLIQEEGVIYRSIDDRYQELEQLEAARAVRSPDQRSQASEIMAHFVQRRSFDLRQQIERVLSESNRPDPLFLDDGQRSLMSRSRSGTLGDFAGQVVDDPLTLTVEAYDPTSDTPYNRLDVLLTARLRGAFREMVERIGTQTITLTFEGEHAAIRALSSQARDLETLEASALDEMAPRSLRHFNRGQANTTIADTFRQDQAGQVFLTYLQQVLGYDREVTNIFNYRGQVRVSLNTLGVPLHRFDPQDRSIFGQQLTLASGLPVLTPSAGVYGSPSFRTESAINPVLPWNVSIYSNEILVVDTDRRAREQVEIQRLEEVRQLEAQRLEIQRVEAERIAQDARLAEEARALEVQRLEDARLERERIEAERLEQERAARDARALEAQRLEAERLEQEQRAEDARLAQAQAMNTQRLEIERLDEEHRSFEARIQNAVDENARQVLEGERFLWTLRHPLYQDYDLILSVPGVSDEIKADILYRRGFSQVRVGRLRKAVDDYNAALLMPTIREATKTKALMGRGVAQMTRNRPQEAIDDYTAALRMSNMTDKMKIEMLTARGVAQMSLNRPQEALDDYEAIFLFPALCDNDKAEALMGRGVAQMSLNRPQEALDDYTAALSVLPVNCEDMRASILKGRALMGQGKAQANLGRPQEALEDYTAALSVLPGPCEGMIAKVLYRRGRIQGNLGRHQEALEGYTKAADMINIQDHLKAKIKTARQRSQSELDRLRDLNPASTRTTTIPNIDEERI